jgi:hypothetical protein
MAGSECSLTFVLNVMESLGFVNCCKGSRSLEGKGSSGTASVYYCDNSS